ncbi:MAG: hypothetical protein JW818_08475 [Pirellulales bacterium]|nr:hypothetical protein [Pirellulales bacterium]
MAFVAIPTSAFFRGDYVLGTSAGVAYAFFAVCLLYGVFLLVRLPLGTRPQCNAMQENGEQTPEDANPTAASGKGEPCPENPSVPASWTLRRIGVVLAFATIPMAAFLRGDFLLGPFAGVVYAITASYIQGVVLLRSQWPRWLRGLVAVLAIPLAYVLWFPADVNPDVQHFVDKQACEREVHSRLHAIFKSDARFSRLSVSTKQTKCIVATIHGSIDNREDLFLLRSRVLDKSDPVPALIQCDVKLRHNGATIEGIDW